jgi:glycopeptide antibiotics resistance protein
VYDFNSFYRNLSIVFALFYFAVIIYGAFVKDAFPWAFPVNNGTSNFIPFGIIATQIEDYLYDYIPLSDIITYLATRIIVFIPYGFYITLLLRRQSKLTRFFALLQLPLIIEILQYFFIPRYCDIDDLIYALIGGLLGSLLFLLTAVIFHAISGKEFLSRENDYRFSGGSLYY